MPKSPDLTEVKPFDCDIEQPFSIITGRLPQRGTSDIYLVFCPNKVTDEVSVHLETNIEVGNDNRRWGRARFPTSCQCIGCVHHIKKVK